MTTDESRSTAFYADAANLMAKRTSFRTISSLQIIEFGFSANYFSEFLGCHKSANATGKRWPLLGPVVYSIWNQLPCLSIKGFDIGLGEVTRIQRGLITFAFSPLIRWNFFISALVPSLTLPVISQRRKSLAPRRSSIDPSFRSDSFSGHRRTTEVHNPKCLGRLYPT